VAKVCQKGEPLKRDFYVELCRLERWSSRQVQERMQSMLFERSALSRPQRSLSGARSPTPRIDDRDRAISDSSSPHPTRLPR